jgi:putative ABC transport system permease protein
MKRSFGDRVRPLVALAWLVTVQRARRDFAMLAATTALVALAVLVAIAGPHLVLRTLDSGAAETVAAAGSRADLLAIAAVGYSPGYVTTGAQAISLAGDLPARLPAGLRAVNDEVDLTVATSPLAVRTTDSTPTDNEQTSIAMLTEQNAAELTVTAGTMPKTNSDGVVPVVVSGAIAKARGLTVGSELDVALGQRSEVTGKELLVTLRVVGLVTTETPEDWVDAPNVWTPFERPNSLWAPPLYRFTVLTDAAGIDAISQRTGQPVTALIRMHISPDRLTYKLATTVPDEVAALNANSRSLAGDSGVTLGVRSDIGQVLAPYPTQAKAALAQMSVMLAGVLGIAGTALLLLTRLLVLRRQREYALERARGSSVISTGFRAALESVIVAAIGVTLGCLVALVFIGQVEWDPLPIVVVAVIAVLASPLQAMALARSMWRGVREPANRRDRQRIARRGKARRFTLELLVVALAALALVGVRGRNIALTRTDGIDPLLAATPLLLAAAITLVVIRIFPLPIRLIVAAARPSRGVLGLMGAVRAQFALAPLPIFALMLGVSLTVSGGLLVDTVRSGMDEASWQRVGADARIAVAPDEAPLSELRSAPGVTAAASYVARPAVGVDLGPSSTSLTIIGIDNEYPDVVDALPGLSGESLRGLAMPTAAGDPLSIVVDQATAKQLSGVDIVMYYGPSYVPLHVIGTTSIAPTGYLAGPFAYVNLEALAAVLPTPFDTGSVLVVGPGTDAAVNAANLPADSALTRAVWIQNRESLALVSGVQLTLLWAVIAAAALSTVALIATVIRGSRERGQSLSLLRTLGMRRRFGWWLALSELAPILIAAVLGGIVAGVVIVFALEPALGLDVLAGGLSIPDPSIEPVVIAALPIAAFALLILGALADVIVHRRDRLTDVLRVGETA